MPVITRRRKASKPNQAALHDHSLWNKMLHNTYLTLKERRFSGISSNSTILTSITRCRTRVPTHCRRSRTIYIVPIAATGRLHCIVIHVLYHAVPTQEVESRKPSAHPATLVHHDLPSGPTYSSSICLLLFVLDSKDHQVFLFLCPGC